MPSPLSSLPRVDRSNQTVPAHSTTTTQDGGTAVAQPNANSSTAQPPPAYGSNTGRSQLKRMLKAAASLGIGVTAADELAHQPKEFASGELVPSLIKVAILEITVVASFVLAIKWLIDIIRLNRNRTDFAENQAQSTVERANLANEHALTDTPATETQTLLAPSRTIQMVQNPAGPSSTATDPISLRLSAQGAPVRREQDDPGNEVVIEIDPNQTSASR